VFDCAVTHSAEPIQIPAPCVQCDGIAFRALAMAEYCQKCNRRKVVAYHVEPESAFKTVVRVICASCFDVEAEKAKVKYTFVNVSALSWNEQPPPRNPYKRKRKR
jgi:hypothetical protein